MHGSVPASSPLADVLYGMKLVATSPWKKMAMLVGNYIPDFIRCSCIRSSFCLWEEIYSYWSHGTRWFTSHVYIDNSRKDKRSFSWDCYRYTSYTWRRLKRWGYLLFQEFMTTHMPFSWKRHPSTCEMDRIWFHFLWNSSWSSFDSRYDECSAKKWWNKTIPQLINCPLFCP